MLDVSASPAATWSGLTPSTSATMTFITVTMPQPTSCRLAPSSKVPSSFIFSVMLLASANLPNMPFLWAPQATPTPRR